MKKNQNYYLNNVNEFNVKVLRKTPRHKALFGKRKCKAVGQIC